MIMLVFSVSITIILLVMTFSTIKAFNELSQSTDEYIELNEAANDLMNASDYLTDEAQCYSLMWTREHLDNYFYEAEKERRRDKAVKKIEEYLPDSEAVQEIKGAMRESLSLMNREYYAMMLVLSAQNDHDIPEAMKDTKLSDHDQALSAGAKKRLAEKMMHDSEYYAQKNMIRKHLNNCLNELKRDTYARQEQTKERLHRNLIWMVVMIILQSLAIVLILLMTTRMGINPLIRAVEHIKRDQDLPIMGAYEYRYLAGAYNKMYSAYKKSIENLSYKASHDMLTGVYNRSGYDLIKQNIDFSTTAFMLVDADEFKEINDSRGHDVGDHALQKIAATLRNHFRSDDYICRVGGDEFVVIMIHVDEEIVPLIEKKIVQINEELMNTDDGLPPMTISAGVSYCRETDDPQQVFNEADAALYKVKKNGKKGCGFFKPEA